MADDLLYWLWLTKIKGVGYKTSKRLLEVFKGPQAVYEAAREELMEVPGVGPMLADAIRDHRSLVSAEDALETAGKHGIKVLTLLDERYPSTVRSLPDAPTVLYYKGTIPDSKGVLVIGSRRCTHYGKQVASDLATYLAGYNVPVIGGLSKGIEGYAHTATIKAGGSTLAFLSHGLDTCYPKEHRELMDAIVDHGAVLSQFPVGCTGRPTNFPKRNYLMSAWAQTVVLVEATERSAALITARRAKELGCSLYAVPGNVYSRESQGTNKLIAEGAQIYVEPAQLLDGLPRLSRPAPSASQTHRPREKRREAPPMATTNSPLESQILEILGDSKLSLETIAQAVPIARRTFLETISLMQLDGKIRLLPGGFVCRLQ